MRKGIRPQPLENSLTAVGHPIHIRKFRSAPDSHTPHHDYPNEDQISVWHRVRTLYPHPREHLLQNQRNPRAACYSIDETCNQRTDELPAHRSQIACIGPKALKHVAEELEAEKEMRKLLEKLHASTQLISKHTKSVNHSCFHSQDTGTKTYWAKATSYRSLSL